MAMANVAELLYSRGLRVLMIDFDLEAPGLERYFDVPEAKYPPDIVLSKRGLIDLMYSYKGLRSLPRPNSAQSEQTDAPNSRFSFPVEPLTNFVVPLYGSAEVGNSPLTSSKAQIGSLSIITAGRRDGDEFKRYAERLRSLDWDDFFANWDGELFFDWFREEASKLADVILIDSRTGVTEMSGVCTYQLADVVVMFVTPNYQNLNGTQMMATSLANPLLIKEGRKGRPLSQVFVPSRVESGEGNKLDEFARQFDKTLGALIAHELKFETSAFIDLKVPYVPYYAFIEDVAVREPDQPKAADLVKAMEKLTGALAQLAPLDSRFYELYRRQRSAEDIPLRQQIKVAEDLVSQLPPEEAVVARRIVMRLVRLAQPGEGGDDTRLQANVEDFSDSERTALGRLVESQLIVVEADNRTGKDLVRLSHEGLIKEWKSLRKWLNEDRDFLLWRQKLRAQISDWESHGRRRDELLTGPRLTVARDWLAERSHDLNRAEKEYIDQSNFRSRLVRRSVSVAIAILLVLALFIAYTIYKDSRRDFDKRKRDVQASQYNISGNDSAAKGDYLEAISFYNKALQEKPDSAEAYYNRGNAYRKLGDTDHAIADYSKAIEIQADSPEAINNRGLAYLSKGDFKRAIDDFSAAIANKPDYAEAYFNRATANGTQNVSKDLIFADYAQAIKYKPNYAEAFRDRGNLFFSVEDYDQAISDYNEARKQISDDGKLYYKLGLAYMAKDDKENAATNFQRTLVFSRDPDLNVEASKYLQELGVRDLTPAQFMIYVQYNDNKDVELVNLIGEEIRKRGFNVEQIQQNSGRTNGDVRFYHDEDRSEAEAIARLVQARLARVGRGMKIQAIFLGNAYKGVPRGQVEVWLPSLPEPTQSPKEPPRNEPELRTPNQKSKAN